MSSSQNTSTQNNRPLPLHQVMEEEYERLHNQAPPSLDQNAKAKARLGAIINDIHKKEHTALCLSGGGIRSATFALGVLQELARTKLLDKFSYLSTVSGGGYMGGWFSAWIHRHPEGLAGVMRELGAKADTKLEPESEPIQHLRTYSNYLTPRFGLFSADTWTVAAIVVRNLILNWLVLVPMLVVVLLIPRLSVASIHSPPNGSLTLYVILVALLFALVPALIGNKPFNLYPMLLTLILASVASISLWFCPLPTVLMIGFVGGAMSITYAGIKRPSSTLDYNSQEGFLKWCLLPLLVSAVALTTFWAWFRNPHMDVKAQLERLQLPEWMGFLSLKNPVPHYSIPFVIFGILLYLTAWILYSAWLGRFSFWKSGRGSRFDKFKVYEFFAMLVSGAIGGVFLWLMATKLFSIPVPDTGPYSTQDPNLLLYYASFAFPLYLALFLLTAILFAGISSESAVDEDREWWARFCGWILVAITVWSVISYLALLGPHLFDYAWGKYVVPAGGLIGFITTRLAQSAKSPANAEQKQSSGWRAAIMRYLLPLGALLFIGLLIVLLSFGINYLLAILTLIFGDISLEPIIGTKIMGDRWALLADSMPEGDLHPLKHMNIICAAPFRLLVTLLVVISGLGYFLSRRINTNKFSYHAMYRNRLIRAYLGASNRDRFPNPFTGFDSTDNIPVCELGPEFFHPGSFRDIGRLIGRLKVGENALSIFFRGQLSSDTIKHLDKYNESRHPSRALQGALIADLNKFVQKSDTLFDDTPAFSKEMLTAKALALFDKNLAKFGKNFMKSLAGDELLLFNRRLVESAFPEDIHECLEPPHKPLHVVNIALNLVRGKNLAWQDRKAASFTVSPLHSGSCQLPDFEDEGKKLRIYGSYRRSKDYGGNDDGGISLGTAVAISGAAVSPNMGYNSSPLVTFLMTLFNVRLGWWLGNPGKAGSRPNGDPDKNPNKPIGNPRKAGKDYYQLANPKSSAYPIVAEALGLTDDENSYVYLSDGGHFENLGLYEMVLRRCHQIVVSDASDDFEFKFDNLGNAIRKVRVDFGIPIEFDPMFIYPRSKDKPGAFCAIGHIRYSQVDEVDQMDSQGRVMLDAQGKPLKESAPDGILIYIKPVFYGDEPRDIYHYAKANKKFPHESTADQWFGEEQFESYRSLGVYTMKSILGEKNIPLSLDDFTSLAKMHVKNFKKEHPNDC